MSEDRLWKAFRSLVDRATHRLKYFGRFAGKIVEQAVNLEVGVKFSGEELAGQVPIPIRPGLPGFTCKVPSGTKCAVGFEDGDPRRPVVVGFEAGTDVTELVFAGGTKGAARVDDAVDCGKLYVVTSGGFVTAIAWVPPGYGGAAPPGAAITLTGKIAAGSLKLKIG